MTWALLWRHLKFCIYLITQTQKQRFGAQRSDGWTDVEVCAKHSFPADASFRNRALQGLPGTRGVVHTQVDVHMYSMRMARSTGQWAVQPSPRLPWPGLDSRPETQPYTRLLRFRAQTFGTTHLVTARHIWRNYLHNTLAVAKLEYWFDAVPVWCEKSWRTNGKGRNTTLKGRPWELNINRHCLPRHLPRPGAACCLQGETHPLAATRNFTCTNTQRPLQEQNP